MEQGFLIDTNIIIDAFGHEMPDKTKEFIARLIPVVSVVTYIETLGWHKATSKQLAPLYDFMNTATILPIDQLVIEQTILIKAAKENIPGDAIIAATAILHNLTLITRNINDFKSIRNLKIINPWE